MLSKIIFSFYFFFITSKVFSQSDSSENFFHSLIFDDTIGKNLINENDLNYSQRFGINYFNEEKFFIGYDIDKGIKEKIKSGILKYFISEQSIEDGYSKGIITIPEINYSKEFYFLSGKLINPIKYYTRNWKKLSSRYFDFLISDEKLFNEYCAEKLDSFIESTGDILKLSEDDKTVLSKEKVLYVFSKDQDEIKSITGYSSRGQFIVNYDAVVTTYSCHFHEVAHFLINYKLKNLSLYTVPFLQEGFAVALGGRGSQSANVLNDIGYYLIKNNISDYKNIFETDGFKNEDATISYPIAGVFSRYLIEKNIDDYLKFYKNLSGTFEDINKIKLNSVNSNIFSDFERYISKYKYSEDIAFKNNNNFIQIKSDKSFFLTPENSYKNYTSGKFIEILKEREYKGEKYYFAINENEINIYNLYSNELIASYVNSFEQNPVKYFTGSEYFFFISESLLDEDYKSLKISYP
jgi:translation initiation factor 2 beta subunit (eIF-2beta)/eIF-5